MIWKLTRVQFAILAVQTLFANVDCYNFYNNYTGLIFEPYILQTSQVGTFDLSLYTKESIKTMVAVIWGKFSKILVQDRFTSGSGGKYIRNFSYNHESRASLYAAEAASLLNRQHEVKNLTVMYMVTFSPGNENRWTDIVLALEAAELANNIFPGTVDSIGLMFTKGEDLMLLQEDVELFRALKNRTAQLNATLGMLINGFRIDEIRAVVSTYRQIFIEFDEVGFFYGRLAYREGLSLATDLKEFQEMFAEFRNIFAKIHPKAHISVATGCPSSFAEGVERQRSYWEATSAWAVQQKLKLYLHEAFDSPWKSFNNHSDHMGWWKLSDNSKLNLIEGYVEKIAAKRPFKKDTRNTTSAYSSGWSGITIIFLVGGIVTGALIIVGFLLLLIYHVQQSEGLSANEINEFLFGASTSPQESNASVVDSMSGQPYDKSLEIPKDKLKIDKNNLLGSGQFGCVYSGCFEASDGNLVNLAVKVAKSKTSSSALKAFLFEIKILSFLGQHPNIVSLAGAYTAELSSGIVYLATELCSLGSLQAFLRNRQLEKSDQINEISPGSDYESEDITEGNGLTTHASISTHDMIRWSHGIACGMEHLESKHVVHADLATRNVLLTSDKTAKVADFGLSRRMYNYSEYVKKGKEPLPWKWMAIESLKRMEFSSKTDVWSYGITLWEIFSMGDTPYAGKVCCQEFIDELVGGLRPKSPTASKPEFYKLMMLCWHVQPTRRPSFSELASYSKTWLQQYGKTNEETDYGTPDYSTEDYMGNSELMIYKPLG